MDDQLRRRSVGAPAARSTLLSILGEYVAPDNRDVYRDTLVQALEVLGYTTNAARQALVRSVAAGWLRSWRVGRRSRVALTPQTHAMLRAGSPRIFGFGDPWQWDGRWLLVVVRVPEGRRGMRDRLRTQLAWAGFGSLGGGVWISPHIDRGDELQRSGNGDGAGRVLIFSAEHRPAVGNPETLVEHAWDLAAIAERYRTFVSDFDALRPRSALSVFQAQTAMLHAWRKFPFLDPVLPRELLPPDWPGDRARHLFRDRHARWRGDAEGFFASLEASVPSRRSKVTVPQHELRS